MGRKEMRMAKHKGFHLAISSDGFNCLIVEERNAIPEDVSLRSAHEIRRLSNCELRFCTDSEQLSVRRLLCVHRVEDIFVVT